MTHEHGLDSGQQVNKAESQILSGNHISARRHSINCGSFLISSTLFNYFGLEIIASLEDATREGFLGDSVAWDNSFSRIRSSKTLSLGFVALLSHYMGNDY